jgi:hypothetical protein
MKTVVIDVEPSGTQINLVLTTGVSSGQVVLVLSDEVAIKAPCAEPSAKVRPAFREYSIDTGSLRVNWPLQRLFENTMDRSKLTIGGNRRASLAPGGWICQEEPRRAGHFGAARNKW